MKYIKYALPAVLVLASLGVQAARYNGEDRGKPVMPNEVNAMMKTECSGCHLAYPPGLMSANSWRKLMAGLDKHFGTDASLPPQDTTEITNYLVKYESNRWTASTAPVRITEAEWFKAKHNGEIDPAVFKRESVKSRANCAACHPGAEAGDFDENRVKIPK